MARKQSSFPDWFGALPDRWRARLSAQFTIHRDGYMRWHRGAPRFVCGKSVAPEAVEAHWEAKRGAIDGELDAVELAGGVTAYRVIMGEYLADREARVGAAKARIAQRTYDNDVRELNGFGAHRVNGAKVADMDIRDIGPAQFTDYAAKFKDWKASGFDSVVCIVSAFFRWCVAMEYIDRYRPGPSFVRPSKQDKRDDRIARVRAFTAPEVAKMLAVAGPAMRCLIGLGAACALNNSEVSNLTRDTVDLVAGLIDFRRRKQGKVRRVCPIPAEVLADLRAYQRPNPIDRRHGRHIFLTVMGTPYDATPTTLSILMRRVMQDAGLKVGEGRNFAGLRTTWFQLAPRDGFALERLVIAGHQEGRPAEVAATEFESYVEHINLDRLRQLSDAAWAPISNARRDAAHEKPGA